MAKAYIDENGIHIPTYPEVLEDLQTEYRSIYGDDVYLEPDSQDGQFLAILASRYHDIYTLAQSVYNAYSPHTAQGVGLSSVVKVNGISRDKSSKSQVPVRLVGTVGTIINNGIVKDNLDQRWILPKEVVIPESGEVSVTAMAEQDGAVRAEAHTITTIATPTRGWQAVENKVAATVGAPIEQDATLRKRQRISTALPSLTVFDGIEGAVAQVKRVTRHAAYENDTNQTDEHGIPPHSVCFVVEGGDSQTIGEMIALKKTPGCGTFGDETVYVTDSKGVPKIIRYFRPVTKHIEILVNIRPLSGYLASTGGEIRANLHNFVNSHPIGFDVLISKLYTPINTAEPDVTSRTFDVESVLVREKGAEEFQSGNFLVDFKTAVACELEDVTVEVVS